MTYYKLGIKNYNIELLNINMEREENNSTVIYRNLNSKYTIYEHAHGLPTILDHCRISEISI